MTSRRIRRQPKTVNAAQPINFLVIGASGFLGRALMTYAPQRGHNVLGTQAAAHHPGLIEFDLRRHRIAVRVNFDRFAADRTLFAIVCSAISKIDRCKLEQKLSYEVNVEKTIRLLRDLADLGAAPVFISTSCVFDGAEGGYDERSPRSPICEYGRQKALVEEFLTAEMPQVLVVRPDKIVGSDFTGDHLFTQWANCVQRSEPIECIAGQTFCPTLVEDVARTILITCELGLSGVYHAASTEAISRFRLAQQFARIFSPDFPVTERPLGEFAFADKRPLNTSLDSSKLRAATQFSFAPAAAILAALADRNSLTRL